MLERTKSNKLKLDCKKIVHDFKGAIVLITQNFDM